VKVTYFSQGRECQPLQFLPTPTWGPTLFYLFYEMTDTCENCRKVKSTFKSGNA